MEKEEEKRQHKTVQNTDLFLTVRGTSRKAQHLPLVYRIERARKGLAKLEEEMKEEGASEGAEGRDTFMAFVTFKTVEAR
eukprot:3461178-Rhodomonas_salina.4